MTGNPTQTWSADLYAQHAAFVPDHGVAWVDALGAIEDLDVLDLGCGDGALTQRLVARGARVVAVDASEDLVAAAQKNGIDARVIDGRELPFENDFDIVFSHAALHWMKPPQAVLRGVMRALKSGGRFIADMGGAGNVEFEAAALEAALNRRGLDGQAANPWFFPTVDEYSDLLTAAGFTIDAIDLFERPTPIDSDIEGWLATFADTFLRQVDRAERDTVIAEVADSLRPHLCDSNGRWMLDYVRLRFAAHVD